MAPRGRITEAVPADIDETVETKPEIAVERCAATAPRQTDTHGPTATGGQGRPSTMRPGRAPRDPRRRPLVIGRPAPAEARRAVPPAIVERRPAPRVARAPIPTAIAPHPSAAVAVGLPVGIHHRDARTPAPAGSRDLDPRAVGRKRFVERVVGDRRCRLRDDHRSRRGRRRRCTFNRRDRHGRPDRHSRCRRREARRRSRSHRCRHRNRRPGLGDAAPRRQTGRVRGRGRALEQRLDGGHRDPEVVEVDHLVRIEGERLLDHRDVVHQDTFAQGRLGETDDLLYGRRQLRRGLGRPDRQRDRVGRRCGCGRDRRRRRCHRALGLDVLDESGLSFSGVATDQQQGAERGQEETFHGKRGGWGKWSRSIRPSRPSRFRPRRHPCFLRGCCEDKFSRRGH